MKFNCPGAVALIATILVSLPAFAQDAGSTDFAQRLYSEAPEGFVAEFTCRVGDRLDLAATHVSRVAISQTSVFSVRVDGDAFVFRCLEKGATKVVVTRGGVDHVILLNIAAADEAVENKRESER